MPRKTIAQKRAEVALAFPRIPGRGARMFNAHSLCREYAEATGNPVPVYVGYRTQESGRAYQSAAWQVHRPGYKTDPEGHWRDYGDKTFNVFAPMTVEKATKLEEAKAWASERYGVTAWARTDRIAGATDCWFPVEVVEWLESEIRTRLEEADG